MMQLQDLSVQSHTGSNPVHATKFLDMRISKETNEFINKIDSLCWEYGFEIWPTDVINQSNEDGSYPTFTIHNMETGEKVRLIYIDGDGRPLSVCEGNGSPLLNGE